MNLHENTVFGRKIFFLYPPYDVEKIVLQKLSDMEYEIYTIGDWKKAKSILCNYPDSICFINIDTAMSADNWFNFVMSFEQDEKLSTIFLGIISERARKVDRERFMLQATIPAGFISMNMDLEDLTQTLSGVLDINGAKGRRKYVRAEGIKDNTVYGKCRLANHDFTFPIDSISSVGLSGVLPLKLLSLFPVNTVFRELTIVLQSKEIRCGAAVIANKTGVESFTMVLLFLKGTSYSTKAAIRLFIRGYLQNAIMTEVITAPLDLTDYSKAPKGTLDATLNELSIEEAEEEIEEAELVPDSDDTFYNDEPSTQNSIPNSPVQQPSSIPPQQAKNNGNNLDSTMTTLF